MNNNTFNPLVSVLLLTYNHEKYIRQCIESIIADDYKNIEILCCENGSSDNTFEAAEKARVDFSNVDIRIFRNPPKTSVTAGLNTILKQAKGDLVLVFSGDDLFVKNRIADQVTYFQEKPNLQVLYANGLFLGGELIDGQPVHDKDTLHAAFEREPKEMLKFIFDNKGLMIQTFMIKRALLNAVGGFDEDAVADDWVINIRIFSFLTKKEQYSFFNKNVFLYRQHGSNSFKNYPRQSASMIEVIDKYYNFPDRKKILADMYFFQVKVGLGVYKTEYLLLSTKYFLNSLRHQFSIKRVIQYFVLLAMTISPIRKIAEYSYKTLKKFWLSLRK